MKAERRHELQTNELADFLAQRYQKHREQLPTVLWALVAIVALITAITLWSSRRGGSQLHAWEEFDQIRNTDSKARPKRLKELIERHPNSEVALWARLDLADQLCFDGREKMPLDREIAQSYLKEAQANYAAVLENQKARPEMIRRAALAEAKCWELMGDREKAITTYQAAAEKYQNLLPELAANAKERAKDLAQPEAADFYKWLAEYKAPTAPSLNVPGLGPAFPPLGGDKAEAPDTTPPTGDSKSSDSTTDAEKKESSEAKSGDEPKSAADQEKPVDEKSESNEPKAPGDSTDNQPATPKDEDKTDTADSNKQ